MAVSIWMAVSIQKFDPQTIVVDQPRSAASLDCEEKPFLMPLTLEATALFRLPWM